MKYLFLKGQQKPEYGIFIPRSDIEVMCIFGQKLKKKKWVTLNKQDVLLSW